MLKKIICVILACFTLTSCSFISMKAIPAKQSEQLEKYVWADEAHSTYAFESLDENLRQPYLDIVKGALALQDKINTTEVSEQDLKIIFQAITRDYPIINWLGETYSFTKDFSGGTTVQIDYSKNENEVNLILTQLNAHTSVLLGDINPNLSDYDKALKVHDILVETVTYDLEAPNQREAYGAIVDKNATCQGYAKAYQFLLLKLGIESSLVFGDSGERHAWNMVKLDDEYYYSDVTFDDRELSDGRPYLSREFLFVDEKTMNLTHKVDMIDTVFELPDCISTEHSFFEKNSQIIDTSDRFTIEQMAKELTEKTIDAGECVFQIKFTDSKILAKAENDIMSNGLLDTSINMVALKYSGVAYIGRSVEEKTNIVTFIFKYAE